MLRPSRLSTQTTAAALASIGVHAVIFVASAVVVAHRMTSGGSTDVSYPLPSPDDVLVVELPEAQLASPDDAAPSAAAQPVPAPPPEPPGGARLARVDTGRAGHGGDEGAVAPARNLAPRV